MAASLSPFLFGTTFFPRHTFLLHSYSERRTRGLFMATVSSEKSTKLVTFLGKGGSGKTTTAILAAQYYAKIGLRTCLVIQSQDPTAESLIGCKIGTSPVICNDKLSAVRLETNKILLEPLDRLKKADARLNLTQGALGGVLGEELGVLPGMDSIFSLQALEKLVGFLGRTAHKINKSEDTFDMIVYDGISTEETLRMIGAAERARWYLKYFRSIAEKSDIGRLTAPSFLKLADESVRLHGGSSVDGRTSAEIWDEADRRLEKASASFAEPSKFGCYLVMDPNNPISVDAAFRYWGCAIQAGAQVSGAFGFASKSCVMPMKVMKKKFFPLDFAFVPNISTDSSVNWDSAIKVLSEDAKRFLCRSDSSLEPSVTFDRSNKSVILFMPGFDKSEIKLYQPYSIRSVTIYRCPLIVRGLGFFFHLPDCCAFAICGQLRKTSRADRGSASFSLVAAHKRYRGGSELLVEAGDQRRVIRLPIGLQGKFGGAKFVDRSLIVTLQ